MRCTRHRLVLCALDPFQLFHQVLLCWQTPGRVGYQDVHAARFRSRNRVEHDRRRVTAALRNHFDRVACAPDRELFARRCTKRIARCQQNRFSLIRKPLGELPDRRCLPCAVDAGHHQHEWARLREIDAAFGRSEYHGELVAQRAPDFVLGQQPVQLDTRLQGIDQMSCSRNANVGADQCQLELLQERVVDDTAGK